jgi:hypothetical protein
MGSRGGSVFVDQSTEKIAAFEPFATEHLVEGGCQLAVAVVDQEACLLEQAGEAEIAACWVTRSPVASSPLGPCC